MHLTIIKNSKTKRFMNNNEISCITDEQAEDMPTPVELKQELIERYFGLQGSSPELVEIIEGLKMERGSLEESLDTNQSVPQNEEIYQGNFTEQDVETYLSILNMEIDDILIIENEPVMRKPRFYSVGYNNFLTKEEVLRHFGLEGINLSEEVISQMKQVELTNTTMHNYFIDESVEERSKQQKPKL
jgi:hypothetical protein